MDIDPDTAAQYLQLSGPLGDRLRQVLRQTDDGACMTIENGRCPMWRQDGLCEIQSQLGHDALCKTCREYPRIQHDFGDFVEHGLELSCPEAARLILTTPYEMTETDDQQETAADYDTDAMATLLRSRREALDFLEHSTLPLPHTLAVLLLYAHQVQSELDGGEPAMLNPETAMATAQEFATNGNIHQFIQFFTTLEILTDTWRNYLEPPSTPLSWNSQIAALARYGIYRYWLQAISDYDLICRVKFIIAACILVSALGGDTLTTAQLFSKEIENNPDNVEAILDAAYSSPALTDVHLLGLLLHS